MLPARRKSGPSTSSGRAGVGVSSEVLDQIRTHAANTRPAECCGILLGKPNTITAATTANNVHPTPNTHFEIDPQALINAHRAARNGGPQVLGYYHSHPNGPAEPSITDQAQAARDNSIWAIIGHNGTIKLWRDARSGFIRLSYATGDS